jgi:hypothetical protein
MKIPKSLHKYFWDTDVDKLDFERPYFIINRLLEKGDIKAAKWVRKNFSEEKIIFTIKKYRDFSLQNASFWGLIYKIPLNQIICFQEPYRTIRRTLWPY